jgi:hypothetical protein
MECRVGFWGLNEVVDLYSDGLVSRSDIEGRVFDNWSLHRQKWWSPHWNYLGTYLADLGILTPEPPSILGLLPRLPRPSGVPKIYSVILPYAGFAKPDLPGVILEEIVRRVTGDLLGGHPCYCVGRRLTPQDIVGVNYSRLGGPAKMIALIEHADIVLTARSVSTHIAAAYDVPAVVWAPSDGENWNMQYSLWQKAVVPVEDPDVVEHAVTAARGLIAWWRMKRGGGA